MSDLFLPDGDRELIFQVLSALDAENKVFVLVAPDLRIAGLTGAAKALLGQGVLTPLPQLLSGGSAAALRLCLRTHTGTELSEEIDGVPYRIDVRPLSESLLLYFAPSPPAAAGEEALRAFVFEQADGALATALLAARKLEEGQPPEITKALLAAVRTCTLRIHRVLRHAQALTAPLAASLPDLQPGDLALLCREIAKEAAALQRPKLSVLLEAPLECPAVFDRRLLSLALYNLIANAMAAPGVHRITLRLAHLPGNLSLDVLDDGDGLPPLHLPRLYNGWRSPYSTEQILADAAAGVRWGLGLPLARRIAGLHSGVLLMHAGEPRGTVFSLTFPDSLAPFVTLGQPPLQIEDGFNPAEVEFSTLPYTLL